MFSQMSKGEKKKLLLTKTNHKQNEYKGRKFAICLFKKEANVNRSRKSN